MCIHITFSLSIHPLTDTSVVSISWLLWIMLQWTWECKYFFEILIFIPLGIYPEVGWLDHMIVPFLKFWWTSILFSVMAEPVYILTNSVQERIFFSSHSQQYWSFLFFSIYIYICIVDLQCCVNFCCTANWLSYSYICSFSYYFSFVLYHRILNIVPCAIQLDLVVYPFYI